MDSTSACPFEKPSDVSIPTLGTFSAYTAGNYEPSAHRNHTPIHLSLMCAIISLPVELLYSSHD
jgi:hypothetical protein